MKELLTQYATYHLWANKQIFDVVLKLTPEQQQQEIVSSFPSIHSTLLHIWDAESIWWQRLKLQEHVVRNSTLRDYSTEEVVEQILLQSQQWLTWVKNASDAQINYVFAYQTTKREQFKDKVSQMLLHLFNHGTYHRGQLVTMFRQLGVEKIPATDFIHWSRKK
jgi:uncharacterized damage-inducible protein DinB